MSYLLVTLKKKILGGGNSTKKILFILLICVMLLGSTSCGTSKNEFEIGKKSDVEISQEDVTLSIKEGTLTNTGATFILKNDRTEEIQYGNPYEMEMKLNGEWHKINVVLNFTLPAFTLESGETKEIKIGWKNGYGKLAKGIYRIIKDVDYAKEEGDYEKIYVAAEFTID